MAVTLLRTEQQVDDYVTSQQSLTAEAQALITEYSEFLSSDVSTLAESSRSIPNALSGFLATANAVRRAYEHYPPHASSLVKGTVQLSNATDSTDSTKAASAYALKKLWDYLQTFTVPDATTSVKGKVQLATSLSTSQMLAATPSMLRAINQGTVHLQNSDYVEWSPPITDWSRVNYGEVTFPVTAGSDYDWVYVTIVWPGTAVTGYCCARWGRSYGSTISTNWRKSYKEAQQRVSYSFNWDNSENVTTIIWCWIPTIGA